jgi:hypothetical protein
MSTYLFDETKLSEVKGKVSRFSSRRVSKFCKIGNYDISIGELLEAIAIGDIRAYYNNRGIEGINDKTTKACHSGLHLPSLGQFTAKVQNDGEKTMGDGHSRTEGLIRRLMDGNLTDQEKSYMISLKLISPEEFFKAYENQNPNHTPIEKLRNSDYFFGSRIGKIRKMVNEDRWDGFIKPKFLKQFTYLIYTYRTDANLSLPKYIPYKDIFGIRDITTPLELSLKDEVPFRIYDKTLSDCKDGIEFYIKTIENVIDIMNKSPFVDRKTVKSITSCAPMMTMIVSDQMSKMCDFGTSPLILAKKIVRWANDITNYCKGLTYAGNSTTFANEQEIRKILEVKRG